MGCKPSKIRTNLTSDQPSQIIGSTQLQADQIVVLGDSVFLPVSNPDGKSAIIEVMVNEKKNPRVPRLQRYDDKSWSNIS
jgi:hypothetical protein